MIGATGWHVTRSSLVAFDELRCKEIARGTHHFPMTIGLSPVSGSLTKTNSLRGSNKRIQWIIRYWMWRMRDAQRNKMFYHYYFVIIIIIALACGVGGLKKRRRKKTFKKITCSRSLCWNCSTRRAFAEWVQRFTFLWGRREKERVKRGDRVNKIAHSAVSWINKYNSKEARKLRNEAQYYEFTRRCKVLVHLHTPEQMQQQSDEWGNCVMSNQ